MAGTIPGLASWIFLPQCKNLVWQTRPPGQPPSRSSDTSGLSVVLRWGRFLALRNHDGKGVQRTNEGSPRGGAGMKGAAPTETAFNSLDSL